MKRFGINEYSDTASGGYKNRNEAQNRCFANSILKFRRFVSWEERQSGAVICETIHRSKGLERDAVVVVTEDKDLPDHLLYVGLSRAVSHLVVVAPQELLDRMVERHE